jgi:hypothetical protein
MTISLALKAVISRPTTWATIFLFSSPVLWGAPKKSSTASVETPATRSLYQQAVSESTATPPRASATKSASSASLTTAPEGMLRLKDSYDRVELRTWNWRLGLNLQRYGAEGAYTSPNGESSNLNQAGKTWMPVLELGASSSAESPGLYTQGLLRVGYARQNLNLNTAYGADDASLSTVLMAVQPQIGYQSRSLGIGALFEAGRLSYSQVGAPSSVSGSNLNRSLDYLGYGISTRFNLNSTARSKVQAQLNWIQRFGSGEGKGRIQSSNIDGGIAVLW